MTKVFLAVDDTETKFPEAAEFRSGLVVRADDGQVGLGFVLTGDDGKPLAAIHMDTQQALDHASYLLKSALQMALYLDPVARLDSLVELHAHMARELSAPMRK
ncbi:MAG: hypothetical protein SF172_17980 [Burkholderiales bacterium]|nr:hypothetical protein [Burkholderiales bacterium]